uniref:Uncharacterized protein n=1 Tax=Eiseniibacteriota bacterium TaxID=2212470 RepID=A0A832I740_UNCEI
MHKLEGRKLTLNRETVRKLTEEESKQVNGGATLLCFSRLSACCPCTGTSTIGPTQPLYC